MEHIGQAAAALTKVAFSPNLLKPGLKRLGAFFTRGGAKPVSGAVRKQVGRSADDLAGQAVRQQAARKAAYRAAPAGGATTAMSPREIMARKKGVGSLTPAQKRGYLKTQGKATAGAGAAQPATTSTGSIFASKAPMPKPTAQPAPKPSPALDSGIGGQAQQLAAASPSGTVFSRLAPTKAGAHRRAMHRGEKSLAAQQVSNQRALELAKQRKAAIDTDRAWVGNMRAQGMSDDAIRQQLAQRGAKGKHTFGGDATYVDDVMGVAAPAAAAPAAAAGGAGAAGAAGAAGGAAAPAAAAGGGVLQQPLSESARGFAGMSPAQMWDWMRKNPGKAVLGGAATVGGLHVAGNVLGGGGRRRGGGAVVTY